MARLIPRSTTAVIRQRWCELLEMSSASRSVVHGELETGVHAVVVAPCALKEQSPGEVEKAIRQALASVPEMARPLRLSWTQIICSDLRVAADARAWAGRFARDLDSGRAEALVFLDLAFLEAALLDRLDGSGVEMRFQVPLSTFWRGELMDRENVLDLAGRMVVEGRALIEAADRAAEDVRTRLDTYADVFLRLASLYAGARWRIQEGNFLMELPARGISLSLAYWELRRNPQASLETWKHWIESLLGSDSSGEDFPRSYAA